MTIEMEAVRLESERLILRAHRIDDFPETAALWGDPVVVAHISGTPLGAEQSWARFLRYRGHWSYLGFGYWVVESRETGKFLGEVGFADYRRDTQPNLDGKPEAGWVFRTSAHGRGYATEAVSRMLRWADQHLTSETTVCMFDPAHAASIRVARKVGYGNDVLGRYGDRNSLFLERQRDIQAAN